MLLPERAADAFGAVAVQCGGDLGDTHARRTQRDDRIRRGDLVFAVVPVAGAGIDACGQEQARGFVETQSLDRDSNDPGERTDTQHLAHAASLESPPGGESRAGFFVASLDSQVHVT